jgi:hypothetical protein
VAGALSASSTERKAEGGPPEPQRGRNQKDNAPARLPSSLLFKQDHQPNRKLLAARGLGMVNPHCMEVSRQHALSTQLFQVY